MYRNNDIVHKHDGTFLSQNELQEKFHLAISVMKYRSITSAIPKDWKKLIRNADKPLVVGDAEDYLFVNVEAKQVELSLIYLLLIRRLFQPPTAVDEWCSMYPELHKIDWKDVFQLPYAVVRETKH